MARARKSRYKPKAFESTGISGDTSANLYDSMLTNPSFIRLKPRQKLLYLYAKNQYYGKRKPGRDFPDIPALQGEDLFYLNFSLVRRYGLYTANGQHEFYSDIKILCDTGFMECVSSGRATKQKSVYRFSDRWWKPN